MCVYGQIADGNLAGLLVVSGGGEVQDVCVLVLIQWQKYYSNVKEYVSFCSGAAGFRIIQVHHPAAPKLVSYFKSSNLHYSTVATVV